MVLEEQGQEWVLDEAATLPDFMTDFGRERPSLRWGGGLLECYRPIGAGCQVWGHVASPIWGSCCLTAHVVWVHSINKLLTVTFTGAFQLFFSHFLGGTERLLGAGIGLSGSGKSQVHSILTKCFL